MSGSHLRRLLRDPLLLLLGLVILALSLRLYGLDWGGFHPDEWAISNAVARLGWPHSVGQFLSAESPLNPHWFNYGSLPLYLFRLVSWLAAEARGGPIAIPADIILWRSLSTLADVATLLLVVALGRRLWGPAVGFIGGLLYALAVLPIQLSHFYAVDPLLTTLLTASLGASVLFVQTGSLRWGVAASLALGLALATKASGVPFGLPVVLAWAYVAIRRSREPGGWRWPLAAVGLGGGVALAAFALGQPYALLDWHSFWNDVLTQARLVRGTIEFPYTVQYDQTAPYLYHLRNLVVWGLGPALGVAALLGSLLLLLRTALRRRPGEVLVAAALLVPFLLLGGQQVKFMRYLLPLYPLLALAAALLLVQMAGLFARGPRRLRWAGSALFIAVAASTAFYAFAFISIYSQPHTALRMGRWVMANVPQSAVIAYEAWDQGIPEIAGYRTVTLSPYDPDDRRKVQHLAGILAQSDYVFLFSNRAYGSLPRLPERFPLMRRYYQELLSGGLGFRVAHVEAAYPNLFGLSLADDTTHPAGLDLPPELVTPARTPLVLNLGHADESFTVYDHPKTVLLEKVERLSTTELAARLEPALVPRPPGGGRGSLMMDPELAAAQRSGGTWREVFATEGPAARYPALVWLLAFEAITFAGLPLSLRVFRPLPDRGYLLSKTLSLLLVAYLAWLGASLRLVPFSRWSVLLAAGLLAGLSALVAYRMRRELAHLLRSRWRLFLGLEVLFLLAFAGFTLLRAANPDLWHPWRGGEKPMDLAYLTAVVRSTYMPPYDPWFSGGYLNYYYFGQFLVATLVRLTGIVPEVAFNLAVPLFWALTLGGSFSLVYNLSEASRNPRGLLPLSRGPLLAGLAGAALVALAGNLDGAIQVIQRIGDALAPALAIGEGPWETGQALVRVLAQALDWPSDGYWRASRMIAVPGSISITEFPLFTFLFADLHAHLLALPLTLLALGLAAALALAIHDGRGAPSHLLPLGLLGLVLGALFATNSWDFPTYLLVAPVGVALAHLSRGAPLWRAAAWSGVTAAALLALSIFTFLPFLRSNEAFYTKIVPSPEQTPLRSYLAIFGLPLFIVVSALVTALWRLATSSVSADRGVGAAGPVAPSRPVVGGRRLWGALAVALGSVALAASIAALGYSVVAFNVLLLLGLSAVIFAPGTPLPKRLGFALGGLALLLVAAVDLIAVDDHLVRMNTIFRVYLQSWVLLSLAGGYLLWWVAQEGAFRGIHRSPPKVLFAAGLVLLALCAAAYPVLGTKARLADRFQPLPLTLDGMAYMEKARYGEVNGITVALAPEREALQWLRAHVDGTPVVAEAILPPPPNDIPYYRPLSRVAVYTGLPIVMGWPWHQTQQRGIGIAEPQVQQRMNDVRELFSSPSPDRARAIMRAYGVEYVYVGQLERAFYPAEGLAKFARMPELEAAYPTPQVTIYRLRTDSRPPPERQPSPAPAMMTPREAEGSDMSGYPLIAVIRDIVIIIWGVLGIVAFLVVILVMVALFRILAPLLRSLQATAANVQVTTTLVTEVIAKPLIRVASVYTGVRQGLRTLGRFLRRRR